MSGTGKVVVPCNHELLREAIKSAGMSTQRLADQAGCSTELIARLRSRSLASRRGGCGKDIADRIEAVLGRTGLFGEPSTGLSDCDAAIQQLVTAAPSLTAEQRERLAAVLPRRTAPTKRRTKRAA